jgi:hypothetical protein
MWLLYRRRHPAAGWPHDGSNERPTGSSAARWRHSAPVVGPATFDGLEAQLVAKGTPGGQ